MVTNYQELIDCIADNYMKDVYCSVMDKMSLVFTEELLPIGLKDFTINLDNDDNPIGFTEPSYFCNELEMIKSYLYDAIVSAVIFRTADFISLLWRLEDKEKFIMEMFKYFEENGIVVFPNYDFELDEAYILKIKD